MFLKLCKMEVKYSWRSFVLMYVVLILSSFLINVNEVGNSGFMNFIQGLLIMIFAAAIFAISILIMVNVVRNYARSMFGRESYLTHTLPVTSSQLLLSKTVVAIFWTFISGFVIFASALIFGFRVVGELPSLDQWVYLFQHIDIFNLEVFATLFSFLFEYAQLILQLFFVMTLVHTCYFHKHRFAFGIVIYLILNFVQSFVLDGLLSITPYGGFSITFFSSVYTIDNFGTSGWLSLAITLMLCCVYFFGTRYLLDHKLEVE